MNVSYDDKLEILGLLVGGYLLVTLLGTLIGLPWATAGGTAVGVVQTLGVLISIPVALLIIFVTQGHDLSDLRR
jgi:hypothetical protein